MPKYDYECSNCQFVEEFEHSMKENFIANCKKCNCKMNRLISKTSFALKGGGWYKDGYSSTKKDGA